MASKRRRSPSPESESKPTAPRPEKKKPKLTANGKQPRPSTENHHLLRLLQRKRIMPRKVTTAPLGNALSGELASKVVPAEGTGSAAVSKLSIATGEQATTAVSEGLETALNASRLPTPADNASVTALQETSTEVQAYLDPPVLNLLCFKTKVPETASQTVMPQKKETSPEFAEVQEGDLNLPSLKTGFPETAPRMDNPGLQETKAGRLPTSPVNSWSALGTPLALLRTRPPASNPRKTSRSYDKLAVGRARLISKLRNRRWHPYPTNDKWKCVKNSNHEHLGAAEIEGGLVQDASPTAQDIDVPRSEVLGNLSSGLSTRCLGDPESRNYAGLPSSEVMACPSEDTRSTAVPATHKVLPESIGHLEEHSVSEAYEASGPREFDDTSVHLAGLLSTAPAAGVIGPSQGLPEKCTVNASSNGSSLQSNRLYTTARVQQLDRDTNFRDLSPCLSGRRESRRYFLESEGHSSTNRTPTKFPVRWEPYPSSKQNRPGVLDGRCHPSRKVDAEPFRLRGEDELGGQSASACLSTRSTDPRQALPSVLAQQQPNVRLHGNIGSENAANTNSAYVRSQPGTAENGPYPDPSAFPLQQTEHVTQNEQENVRRAETPSQNLLSEKAAGKKRAESQPDGGSGGQGDAGCEQDSYDMCVDDQQGAAPHAPHCDAPLNPEKVYDFLVQYPNLPCTNASLALLCEMVVDLKSSLNSLRHPIEPEPPIEESAMPTESRHRSNGKGYRSKTATKCQDKKHQPSFLINLKADIRRLMHEFLQYPEKDLTVPAPSQLKQHKKNSEGPRLDPLVLDLASKGSSDWNKRAAKLFRQKFLSLDISECKDEDQVEAIFLTHTDYLRKVYLKQGLGIAGRADAVQRAKDKAKYVRRKELRERRFKSALLPYQNILEMKTIRSIVSNFPADVVSEDEREVLDGSEHYLVVRLDWRSSGADNLCEILDALHMASHFTVDDRPRPGRFSHPRTPSQRLYTELAPPGLPSNLYKPEYLEGLTPDELDTLNVQPEAAFLFPARVMRIAARFRHIKCRGTAPLPRNDPSLSIYVDGETYAAFVE